MIYTIDNVYALVKPIPKVLWTFNLLIFTEILFLCFSKHFYIIFIDIIPDTYESQKTCIHCVFFIHP